MAKKETKAPKGPKMKTVVVLPRCAVNVPSGDPYTHPRSGKEIQPRTMVNGGAFLEVPADLADAWDKMGQVHICKGRSLKAKVEDAKKVYSAARRELFATEHPGAPKRPTERTLAKIYGTVAGTTEEKEEDDTEEETED